MAVGSHPVFLPQCTLPGYTFLWVVVARTCRFSTLGALGKLETGLGYITCLKNKG